MMLCRFRSRLKKFYQDGDIYEHQKKTFYKAVRRFLEGLSGMHLTICHTKELLCRAAVLYAIYYPLDETHLDAVRELILPRSFHPAHQQVELVGAMRLCSTRTNRSAYAYAKNLIQS